MKHLPPLPRGLTTREVRRIRRFTRIKECAFRAALLPFKGRSLAEVKEEVYRVLCDAEAAVASQYGHLLLPADVRPVEITVRMNGDVVTVKLP